MTKSPEDKRLQKVIQNHNLFLFERSEKVWNLASQHQVSSWIHLEHWLLPNQRATDTLRDLTARESPQRDARTTETEKNEKNPQQFNIIFSLNWPEHCVGSAILSWWTFCVGKLQSQLCSWLQQTPQSLALRLLKVNLSSATGPVATAHHPTPLNSDNSPIQ